MNLNFILSGRDPDGGMTHRRDFREMYLTPDFQFLRTHILWTDDGPLEDLVSSLPYIFRCISFF